MGSSERSTTTAKQTILLGREIGRRARPGMVIELRGALGAGKTTLVKGIALGLEIAEAVTSPSFTLISEYSGRIGTQPVTLYHIDLYRISDLRELEDLGLEEILSGRGVAVIEWAEKAAGLLPEDSARVEIAIGERGERHLRVSGIAL